MTTAASALPATRQRQAAGKARTQGAGRAGARVGVLRVGFLCHDSMGGSARVACDLATALAERDHRVHVFTRSDPFFDPGGAAVACHRLRPGGGGPAALAVDWPARDLSGMAAVIEEVVAREGLDLLHFHYALPFAALCAQIKRRLGSRAPLVVGTLHGTDVSVHGADPLRAPGLRRWLLAADGLTTPSQDHARLALRLLDLPRMPAVIPNFVRPGSVAASRRGDSDHPRRRPRIIHVSNFRAAKDPMAVARIYLGIRERQDAELLLVGDGPEMERVKAFLGCSPHAGDVHYLGPSQDVCAVLAQADLLLLASILDSFCLAALEGMACGVPVLATRTGGIPEVVQDGKTGLLFAPGDDAAAVELGVRLLSDPTALRAMGAAAVRRARSFAAKVVVPRYEALYDSLLAARVPVGGDAPLAAGWSWPPGEKDR